MELNGSRAVVAGHPELSRRLAARLREAGVEVAEDGPAAWLIHVWPARADVEPEAVVALLQQAARVAPSVRRICVLREPGPPEPASAEEVHPLAVEDGLRYLAAAHGVPLTLVSAPLDEGFALDALEGA